MAQISITIRPTTGDLFAAEVTSVAGILSDEHPASSYGIPVVLINGQPMGIGDFPADHECVVHYGYQTAAVPEMYETDEQIRTRRCPEQVALAQTALQCGYPIVNA